MNQTESSLPKNYNNLSSTEKSHEIWNRIEKTAYPLDQLPTFSAGQLFYFRIRAFFYFIFNRFIDRIFFNDSDELLSPKRRKVVHNFGTAANFKFVPTNHHPFTGLFAEEAIGICRASLYAPLPLIPKASDDFIPGFALKFYIDGKPSLNISTILSLIGQGDNRNFFAAEMSTHIPLARTFIHKIIRVSVNLMIKRMPSKNLRTYHLPMDKLASIKPNGELVENPKIPYSISLIPQAYTLLGPEAQTTDFRISLANLKPGTLIYKMYAKEFEDSKPIYIGDIMTTNQFTASSYGDELLYFRHEL